MKDITNSRFWNVICILTRTDIDLLSQSNRFDRHTVLWTAVMLLLALMLHTLLWSNMMTIVAGPGLTALALGTFVAIVICTFELALIASDWSLAGVLRAPGFDAGQAARVGFRLAVAALLSIATATGFELWFHGAELTARIEAERRSANAPLLEEMRDKAQRLHALTVAPIQTRLEEKRARVAAARIRADAARADQASAREAANRSALEASREQDGLNRMPGRGPRYNDAVKREDIARTDLTHAQGRERQAVAELSALEADLEPLERALRAAVDEHGQAASALEKRVRDDERYVAARDSVMTRMVALANLKRDKRDGAAARFIHYLTITTLMALELLLALSKLVFAPASVYTVRLIARTRLEALEVEHDLQQATARLHADAAAAPPIEVVAQGQPAEATAGRDANDRRPPLRVVAGENN